MSEAPQSASVALLAFTARQHHFVLDVMRVREIVPIPPVLPTLGGPAWVLGHMLLRDEMVVVVDLGLALQTQLSDEPAPPGADAPGLPEPTSLSPKIVVVYVDGHACGLRVDAVTAVARVPIAELRVDRTPAGLRSPISLGLCELHGVAHRLLDVRPLLARSFVQSFREPKEAQ